MKVYVDALINTTEGDVLLDDGTQVWFLLLLCQESREKWQFGVAETPEIDILTDILRHEHRHVYYREGLFDPIPSDELGYYRFIEGLAREYQEDRQRRTHGQEQSGPKG